MLLFIIMKYFLRTISVLVWIIFVETKNKRYKKTIKSTSTTSKWRTTTSTYWKRLCVWISRTTSDSQERHTDILNMFHVIVSFISYFHDIIKPQVKKTVDDTAKLRWELTRNCLQKTKYDKRSVLSYRNLSLIQFSQTKRKISEKRFFEASYFSLLVFVYFFNEYCDGMKKDAFFAHNTSVEKCMYVLIFFKFLSDLLFLSRWIFLVFLFLLPY